MIRADPAILGSSLTQPSGPQSGPAALPSSLILGLSKLCRISFGLCNMTAREGARLRGLGAGPPRLRWRIGPAIFL